MGSQLVTFNVSVFITVAAAVGHAQIVRPTAFVVRQTAEGPPSDKNHGYNRNVANHVVSDEKQLTSKKPESQTPKTTQHDHGQVLALIGDVFEGIAVNVKQSWKRFEYQIEKFEKRKHQWPR
jgi:hypothetical protein